MAACWGYFSACCWPASRFPSRPTSQPISDDDVVRFIEPLLGAAAIPPILVNLGGDEAIATREVMEHFGKLAGIEPQFAESGFEYPTYQLDAAKRKAITGPCKVTFAEGLRRLCAQHHQP